MQDASETIQHKPLGTEHTYDGFLHSQIYREGDVAMFAKTAMRNANRAHERQAGYEVVIVSRHNGYEIAGVKVEPAEMYPKGEQWGTKGWTFDTFPRAKRAYDRLLAGEHPLGDREPEEDAPEDQNTVIPTVKTTVIRGGRGRPRVERDLSNVVVPEGEFTMEEIATANGMDKLAFYAIAKQFKDEGKIREVRRESRGRGRPTVIFTKVEKETA